MLKTIWIAGLMCWAATASHGATWGDWMAPPHDTPLAAEFRPGWAVEDSRPGRSPQPADFLEPNRGYDGDLIFTLAPGAEAPPGPLSVHLLFSVAPPEDMNWPEGAIPTNFVPAILPASVPRRAVSQEIRTVTAEFPLHIPVVLPRSSASPPTGRTRRPPALFGRYEVRDASGRQLYRGVLPAHKLVESARSLVGMAEDDEAMRQVTSTTHGGAIERVSDLPDELEAYRHVRAIWFTDALWQNMEGREALARRLLLSGVRISGETALVERIRADLGTGYGGQAVSESVAPASWHGKNDFSLRTLDVREIVTETMGQRQTEQERSLFNNEAHLFVAERNVYLAWTLTGMLGFAAGVVVILAAVFRRHKGERRVAVWWALPAWSVGCAAAIWAGGVLLLERRPQADVTEYRLAMADWPEMHVRAVASAMTFEPGRTEWTLPPGATVYGRRHDRLDGWWARQEAEIDKAGIRLRLPRKMTGTAIELEAGWFEPTSVPVAINDGTTDAPGRWVVAEEDLDGVYVLAEGRWRALGPMRTGDRLDPLAVETMEHNRLPGLPQDLEKEWSQWRWREPCRNPDHNHPPDHGRAPPHDWIVVAWNRDVPPRVVPVWDESRTKGRVLWVVQWP